MRTPFLAMGCTAVHRASPWSKWSAGSVLLLGLLFAPLLAVGQTRLEQLEATYQTNLRTLHAPVLQDYLRQLELLKSRYAAAGNRSPDIKHVETEIARVKSIVSTTGVFSYAELEAALAPAGDGATPASKAGPAPAKAAPAVLPTLLAAAAFKGAEIDGKTGAIPLGTAEWGLYKLPAGTYDVLIIFASEALAQAEPITLTIAGREFKAEIEPARSTGSLTKFRLLRLCQVKLDAEVTGSTLGLAAGSQGKPLIWLKKLMFVSPKKPSPPTPDS